MEGMVVLLAVVGAIVVARFALRTFTSSARVVKAANLYQTTAIAAVRAVNDTPEDEPRQIKAIAAWEKARAFIGSLSDAEQRLAAQTLRDRGFPTAEIGRAIEAHVATKSSGWDALDDDLAGITAGVR